MTKFTLADYKNALKGVGPKLRENILIRAALDPDIGFREYVELCDYAYDQRPERRREHGAEE